MGILESKMHINCLEQLAAALAIPEGSMGSVSAVTTGQPDISSVNHNMGEQFPPADKLLQSLVRYCTDHRMYSRSMNCEADT